MISFFRKFLNWASPILRYNGWLVLFWRILQRIANCFGRMELVTYFEKDLTQPLKEVKGPPELTVTLAEEVDLPALVERMGERFGTRDVSKLKTYEDIIRSRLQRGCLCFLGKAGKEIIHYNWIAFNWGDSQGGRFLHLQADQALCLDGFTPEPWRGKGVHPAVHFRMLYYLQQHGYLQAYTLVDTDNKSSKKTHHLHNWSSRGVVLSFTPKGKSQGWVWPLKANLRPFLREQIPN